MDLRIIISKDVSVRSDAYKVRIAVFVEEQGFVDEFDHIDGFAYHVAAYDGDRIIGCGRFFTENNTDEYHIGRIAVLSEYRRLNIGTEIMNSIEKYCSNIGVKSVVLSAQRRARGFYEKIGYEPQGEEYLEEGYPHILMRKEL